MKIIIKSKEVNRCCSQNSIQRARKSLTNLNGRQIVFHLKAEKLIWGNLRGQHSSRSHMFIMFKNVPNSLAGIPSSSTRGSSLNFWELREVGDKHWNHWYPPPTFQRLHRRTAGYSLLVALEYSESWSKIGNLLRFCCPGCRGFLVQIRKEGYWSF